MPSVDGSSISFVLVLMLELLVPTWYLAQVEGLSCHSPGLPLPHEQYTSVPKSKYSVQALWVRALAPLSSEHKLSNCAEPMVY